MTADEIRREISLDAVDKATKEAGASHDDQMSLVRLMTLITLGEIAAQLAELNYNLCGDKVHAGVLDNIEHKLKP